MNEDSMKGKFRLQLEEFSAPGGWFRQKNKRSDETQRELMQGFGKGVFR